MHGHSRHKLTKHFCYSSDQMRTYYFDETVIVTVLIRDMLPCYACSVRGYSRVQVSASNCTDLSIFFLKRSWENGPRILIR